MTPEEQAKKEYTELMMNPILTPARRKGIETLMKRRNMSFEEAMKLQARRIVESKYNLPRDFLKKNGILRNTGTAA